MAFLVRRTIFRTEYIALQRVVRAQSRGNVSAAEMLEGSNTAATLEYLFNRPRPRPDAKNSSGAGAKKKLKARKTARAPSSAPRRAVHGRMRRSIERTIPVTRLGCKERREHRQRRPS